MEQGEARLDRSLRLTSPGKSRTRGERLQLTCGALALIGWWSIKILNHVDGGIIRVYDRWAADPEKATAMERWANRLREIVRL